MPALSLTRIADLLAPFEDAPSEALLTALSIYLDLLLHWNTRTNLTAIRDPEQIVTRHFGESLFVARFLPAAATTLLDLGTGAGFPGVPVQLVRLDLKVTLAESQNKKVAFLRELVRKLAIQPEMWPSRVENMATYRTFDVVTLRAVDDPELALQLAESRLSAEGALLLLGSSSRPPQTKQVWEEYRVPGSVSRSLFLGRAQIVPRGTI